MLTGVAVSSERRRGAGAAFSDCLRTKHLLWPVIKAMGNNGHNIRWDTHTHSPSCECVCVYLLSLVPHFACSQSDSMKACLNNVDETGSKLFWECVHGLRCSQGTCGYVG